MWAIVGDDLVRKVVLIDDVLQDESLYLFIGDFDEFLGFHPFFEVIVYNEQEASLLRTWHRTDYIHCPTHEWVKHSGCV